VGGEPNFLIRKVHSAMLATSVELPQSSARSSIKALHGAQPKLCMELLPQQAQA